MGDPQGIFMLAYRRPRGGTTAFSVSAFQSLRLNLAKIVLRLFAFAFVNEYYKHNPGSL